MSYLTRYIALLCFLLGLLSVETARELDENDALQRRLTAEQQEKEAARRDAAERLVASTVMLQASGLKVGLEASAALQRVEELHRALVKAELELASARVALEEAGNQHFFDVEQHKRDEARLSAAVVEAERLRAKVHVFESEILRLTGLLATARAGEGVVKPDVAPTDGAPPFDPIAHLRLRGDVVLTAENGFTPPEVRLLHQELDEAVTTYRSLITAWATNAACDVYGDEREVPDSAEALVLPDAAGVPRAWIACFDAKKEE